MANFQQEEGTELENSDNWDFDHPIRRKPMRRPRVVVSVPFQSDEFGMISKAADDLDEKLSVFIRSASIEKARLVGSIITGEVMHSGLRLITFRQGSQPLQPQFSSSISEEVALVSTTKVEIGTT